MEWRVLGLALAFSLALGGMAAADTPAAEDPALAKLQQMVGNLGYSTTLASDNEFFGIKWQDDYDFTITHWSISKSTF